MNIKPKPTHTKKTKINVPKRGSIHYWLRIFRIYFVLPMMLISIPTGIILFNCNSKLTLYGPLAGFIFSFFNMIRYHRKFLAMKEKDYIKITQRKAPERGSAVYWLYIIFFTFFIPMIFICIGSIFVLHMVIPKLSFLGFVISPFAAFLFARKTHHQVINLPDEEYEKCFMARCIDSDCDDSFNDSGDPINCNRDDPFSDSGNPYDPASSAYWTFGPGSSTYNNGTN